MNENQQNLSKKENKKFIKIMRENLHTLRETLHTLISNPLGYLHVTFEF